MGPGPWQLYARDCLTGIEFLGRWIVGCISGGQSAGHENPRPRPLLNYMIKQNKVLKNMKLSDEKNISTILLNFINLIA